jgi:hypothetical protein
MIMMGAVRSKRIHPASPDAQHATRTYDNAHTHSGSCIRQTEGVSCIGTGFALSLQKTSRYQIPRHDSDNLF